MRSFLWQNVTKKTTDISKAKYTHYERVYLWWGSEVDDTIQLNVLAKLAVQPAMPVLVHSPLGLIHALALVQVGCKYVPGEQGKFTDKAFQKRQGLAGFSESLTLTLLLSSFKARASQCHSLPTKSFISCNQRLQFRNIILADKAPLNAPTV